LTQLNRSYSYDTVNRVSSASDSSGWSRTFCYDRNGNMWVTGNSGVTLAGNTPQQLGGPCPSSTTPYNGNNQITGANYDAVGNQTVVNGNTLDYDAENRVASALDSVTQSTETYLYDGDGQRVEKSGPAGTTVYIYDVQGRLAAEYSTASSTSPCTTCYLSSDQLGSTRLVTDFSGSVVGRHDYLPFGEEVSPNTLDNISQKFTGQVRDSETGMDFFHARYFGAALGRFTSPDPANAGADITNPQSWNAYAYVLGNPLGLVDPSGMFLSANPGKGNDDGGDEDDDSSYQCIICFNPCFLCFSSGNGGGGNQQPPPPPRKTEAQSTQPPKSQTCPAGATAAGLTYPPGVRQHIEQRHMFLLSNGSGAGNNFPSFNQNGVNRPASQYMFEPDGTPNANWQLVVQLNAKTFSLASPVPSRGNFTFTAALGPQNIPFPLARPFIGQEYGGWLNIFGLKFPFPPLPTDVNTLVTKANCQTVVTSHPGNP
jgi:RHS repeat-associated protein